MSRLPELVERLTGDDSGRVRGDHGAAIVEFALIIPFLALFSFGLVDYGNAYRQENLVQVSVMSAARTNTQMGTNRFADYETLRSVSSSLGNLKSATLTGVIVWKANANNTVPSNCTALGFSGTSTKGVPGLCNVYSAAQVATENPSVGFPAGTSTSPNCTGGWDSNWCPATARSNADGSSDFVGVYIEISYTPLTRMITSSSVKISEQAIYRIEPPYVGG